MKICPQRLLEPDSGTPPAGGDAPTQVISRSDAARAALGVGDTATAAATPPATPFDWSGKINADGSFAPGWEDGLPEKLRGYAKGTKSLESAFERGLEHQTAARTKAEGVLKRPADDAPDTDKAAYKAQLLKEVGVPDKPEGYGIDPSQWKDKPGFSDDLLADVLPKLHSLGYNKEQAEGAINLHNEIVGKQFAAITDFKLGNVDALDAWEKEHAPGVKPGEGPIDAVMNELAAKGFALDRSILVEAPVLIHAAEQRAKIQELEARIATLTKTDDMNPGATVASGTAKQQLDGLTARMLAGEKGLDAERDRIIASMAAPK